MSLFTFQSFFVKKTSYNERFSSWQLTGIILLGFFLFFSCYFLLRPGRLLDLLRGFFGAGTLNKSISYARSMTREIQRIWRFKRSLARKGPEHRLNPI